MKLNLIIPIAFFSCLFVCQTFALTKDGRDEILSQLDISIKKSGYVNACGNAVVPDINRIDLDKFGRKLFFQVVVEDSKCYGASNSEISLFLSEENGFHLVLNSSGKMINVMPTQHKGMFDIQVLGAGIAPPAVWQWDGIQYR